MEKRRFQITIDGPPVKEGFISFALLGRILKGVQDTVYYLALSDIQYDYRQRIRVPQEVQQACAIYRVVEDKGSYSLTAEIAPPKQVGDVDDIGLAAKNKYLQVVVIAITVAKYCGPLHPIVRKAEKNGVSVSVISVNH